jgi:UPF0176 protein
LATNLGWLVWPNAFASAILHPNLWLEKVQPMNPYVVKQLKDRPNKDTLPFVHCTAYQFAKLSNDQAQAYRVEMKEKAKSLGMLGTILLGAEGMNFFLSGSDEAVLEMVTYFENTPEFKDMPYKVSFSDEQPYTRMLVRIKNEIVTMGWAVDPSNMIEAPHLDADTFEKWYEEGKDMVILDTRNDYEIALGKFEGAVDFDIKSFKDFPEKVAAMDESMKDKTIVTYCTGGIRCEKAAPFMKAAGFKNVYQLDGGILRYLEKKGQGHWEGECFVFDKRVAVGADLNETETIQCFACRMPLTQDIQTSPIEEMECPYCHGNPTLGKRAVDRLAQEKRNA